MLTKNEVDVIESMLEKDRLQKQLFQEVCTQILKDTHGISKNAYDTLCELADTFEVGIECIDQISIGDDRVHMTPDLITVPVGYTYQFMVCNQYSDEELWDWAEEQDIATIEHIEFFTNPNRILIWLQWEDQDTVETRSRFQASSHTRFP